MPRGGYRVRLIARLAALPRCNSPVVIHQMRFVSPRDSIEENPSPRARLRTRSSSHRVHAASCTLHSVALWCITVGNPPFWIGSGEHLHHVILGHLAICAATNPHPLGLAYRYGPDSMLPAFAVPEILPLALDHSAGSASGASLGPPSDCRM